MAYSVFAVANAFIELSLRENIPITNMKLQKLVYIAQGFSFALLNKPLFTNEIRALKWGPVIMALYDAVKHFGNRPINEKIATLDPADEIEIDSKQSEESVLINFVWQKYKRYSAAQLSSITHQEGTPWSLIWKDSEYAVIPNDLIESHYREILKKAA